MTNKDKLSNNLNSFFKQAMNYYEDPRSNCHKMTGAHWDVFDVDFNKLIENDNSWKCFRRNGLTCMLETGLYSADRKKLIASGEMYKKEYSESEKIEIIGRYNELKNLVGNKFINNSIECSVGDPRCLKYKDVSLNFDDLYNVYANWQITRTLEELDHEPQWILEIGGGYGNLSAKLKNNYPNAKYVILDLPETLIIQMAYLRQCNKNFKFANIKNNIENQEFDIALIPGWLEEKVQNIKFDLVINTRSIGEMSKDAVDYYFRIIQDTIKPNGLFYCVNRYAFSKSSNAIKIRDFPFDDHWSFIISQPQWLQTHLHEWLTIRKKPIISPKFLLKSFPVRTPPPGPMMENILTTKQWLTNESAKLKNEK